MTSANSCPKCRPVARVPTRNELVLAVIALAAFGVMKLDARSTAAKEAELRTATTAHEEALRTVEREREARAESDRIARDSIATLEAAIEGHERKADDAGAAGAQTFTKIVERIPPELVGLRDLVERREQEHNTEVRELRVAVTDAKSVASVLRGQLADANDFIAIQDSAAVKAEARIDILEDIKDPGLSTLESVSLGAGAYIVTTELLGGSVLEGLMAGGGTFLVVTGGSKFIRWVF